MGKDHPTYTITTDRTRLDLERIHRWLSEESYWARGRSLEIVRRSIENSLVFGAYLGDVQVGIARVVTDYSTFGWLCDVFVAEEHRGQGAGRLLVESVIRHPVCRELRVIVLATRNAQEFYETTGGFRMLERPSGWMVRRAD